MRRLLPRTFPSFLGRFAHPTEIQRIAVPAVLEGRDVLLCAPTATGKTEAYAAPLAERLLAGDRGPFSMLLVSPTRALANDLRRRLEERMASVGIAFGRHTGEHKERVAGSRPEVAVTTPEALDSLLARRPEELVGVRAIVLDEIHVLDGTVRGDQARILLCRLERLARTRPQRVAASATVSDPGGLSERYLHDPVVALHRGRRPIRARGFEGADAGRLAAHLETLARAGVRKILAFAGRRDDVERHAAAVVGRTSFGESVFAHHGSLSRTVRERTERRFLESPAAVAFATLTLELGIDVGSVDYVLLLSPPPGVASLLQRVGRGSRRSAESRVGYVFETEGERQVYRALLSLAGEGTFAEAPYAFRPSVLVQQALVMAGGEGHVTAAALGAALPPALRARFGAAALGNVLGGAADAGLLEPPRGGRYVLSERTERAYRRGLLHSSFEALPERDVVDRTTGEVIGRATFLESAPGDPATAGRGEKVSLGGRGRRIVHEDAERILVDPWKGAPRSRFVTRGSPSLPFRTARAVAERLGAGAGEIVAAQEEEGVVLLHGLGTAGALLLADALVRLLGKKAVHDVGPLVARLRAPLGDLPRPAPGDAEEIVVAHERKLATATGMGRHHAVLPERLRRASVRDAVRLDDVAEFLARARFTVRESPAPAWWREL